MYRGWLTLGGVELINNSRTLQYARRFGVPLSCVDDCPDLAFVLGDDTYQTGFNVPWDDVTQPPGFLGFVGQSITGMSNGTIRSFITDLASDGAAIGAARRGRRELLIQVMAVGLSNAALDYGIAWLNTALRGAVCEASAGCSGYTLCFYDECPSCDGQTPDECHNAHLRNLFNVGILEPPTVVSRHTLSGICDASGEQAAVAVLEYTLVAGVPYIYKVPELIAETSTFVPNQPWFEPSLVSPADCSIDPDCPVPSSPPAVPVPVDECIQHLPGVYDTAFFSIPAGGFSEWFEKVPYIEIYSGNSVMRSVAVRFAPNVRGGNCGISNDYSGLICENVFIPYVASNSTVLVDGRIEKAIVACNSSDTGVVSGITNINETVVYGTGSNLFQWPKFECATSWCVMVQVHADWHDPDSYVKISMVERQDAA